MKISIQLLGLMSYWTIVTIMNIWVFSYFAQCFALARKNSMFFHSHTNTVLITLLTPDVWVYSHTNQSVSCNSSQFWHCLLGIKVKSQKLRAQSHKIIPTSDVNCKFQVAPGTSDWLVKKWVSHDPLLSFNNLWEWLIELRETLRFTGLFYNKGYDKGDRWIAR